MGFYYHWTHFLGLRNFFDFFEFLALLGPLWGNEVFKKFQKICRVLFNDISMNTIEFWKVY